MSYPFLIVSALLLGVLLFGKELPQVAKQIGQGMMEFRKGLNEIKTFGSTSLSVKSSVQDRGSNGELADEDEHDEVIGTKFTPQRDSLGALNEQETS